MANMKTKHWVIILVLVLLGLIIYLANRPERQFENYEFSGNNLVFNLHEKTYLDTIVHVGLDKMELQGALVIIRPQTKPKEIDGKYETEAYIVTNGQQYVIWIKPNLDRAKAINVLAHELIHLKQYATGQLWVVGGKTIMWQGEIIPDITQIEYSERPWEIQAFQQGAYLSKDIKAVLWPKN